MPYGSNILTSIHGRRLGLQEMSTAQTGGVAAQSFLVGPHDFRLEVTVETTGTNAKASGVSQFNGTSAASSSVYTLDPPIPGVRKFLAFNTTGNIGVYVKTQNNETFLSTQGTSFTVLKTTSPGSLELIGLTTAIWLAPDLSSGTSSQASAVSCSTTT